MTTHRSPLSLTSRAVSLLTALALGVTPALAGNPGPSGPTIEIPGELVLTSLTTGATVEINGKVVGTVPLEDSFTLMPGTHTIRLKKRGFTSITEVFKVLPGETVELELDLLPYAGIVKVTSNPPGASVKVDGQVAGTTPLDQDIPAGRKVITVSLPGHQEEVRTVEIRAAQEVTLDFQLPRLVSAKSTDPAFYETWWFWTIIGVAGAGTAAAVIATSGGEVTPTPDLSLTIP